MSYMSTYFSPPLTPPGKHEIFHVEGYDNIRTRRKSYIPAAAEPGTRGTLHRVIL